MSGTQSVRPSVCLSVCLSVIPTVRLSLHADHLKYAQYIIDYYLSARVRACESMHACVCIRESACFCVCCRSESESGLHSNFHCENFVLTRYYELELINLV